MQCFFFIRLTVYPYSDSRKEMHKVFQCTCFDLFLTGRNGNKYLRVRVRVRVRYTHPCAIRHTRKTSAVPVSLMTVSHQAVQKVRLSFHRLHCLSSTILALLYSACFGLIYIFELAATGGPSPSFSERNFQKRKKDSEQ